MAAEDEEITPTGQLMATWGRWFNVAGLIVSALCVVGGLATQQGTLLVVGVLGFVAYGFNRYMMARSKRRR